MGSHGNCDESITAVPSARCLGISSSSLLLPTSRLDEVDQSRHDMEISMALIWYMDNIYMYIIYIYMIYVSCIHTCIYIIYAV